MRSIVSRLLLMVAVVATAGLLNGTACASFAGEQLASTVDFCFLFDCQNGALGGLLDPCPNSDSDSDTISGNLFVDCPVSDE